MKLLQIRKVIVLIRLALSRSDLLDSRARRRNPAEVLAVDAIENRQIVEIVEVHVSGDHLVEIHSSFFQVVELGHWRCFMLLLSSGFTVPADRAFAI